MEIFGLLADNHGRLDSVRAALALFEEQGVEGIIHCGDLERIETLEVFAGKPCWFVWGNMDVPESSWRPVVQACGAFWPEKVPVVIKPGAVQIAVFHGHEANFKRTCTRGEYEYIVHGHTHKTRDERHGRTRIINPGALFRAPLKTVAVLDISSDQVQFFPISSA